MSSDTRTAEAPQASIRSDGRRHLPGRLLILLDRSLPVLFVLAILAVWELVGRIELINPVYTSYPTEVARALWDLMDSGVLAHDYAVSGREFLWGYGLAIAVGVPLGFALALSRRLSSMIQPLVAAAFSTPRLALIGLMIIWFGIGIGSKIAIIFLEAVFQIFYSTESGARNPDEALLKAARAFGANKRQIIVGVVGRGAIPSILTGLRIGAGGAIIGVVVGEFFAANAGLGYRITVASNTFRTDQLFAVVVVLAASSIALMAALRLLERRVDSWRTTGSRK